MDYKYIYYIGKGEFNLGIYENLIILIMKIYSADIMYSGLTMVFTSSRSPGV